ncbi:flagellar basal-body rod protein FlgC [Hydrogenispora ethanolica]|jgi:flagellar basal-body rod protein FlgC|uniref:Flagellar basal-body rod protein FlgC n=1 Tax=Hydrogenispora ethanolica TaxID=1082276 RepID=A0A4V2QE23_HYDET|nr:flagellar basal body rod protein FlgC [Hydrogenispora ethanolica]TCL66537.1 flagellar basal-body rod protein FlgC [Hydrogenispora ethanolica]
MNLFRNFDINASGLTAERLRMDLISNNIANANSTRTPDGGPYQRKVPVFAEVLDQAFDANGRPVSRGAGVRVAAIENENKPPRLVYDPSHPDADAQGYVAYPDINPVVEMVNLITASRAYEANVTAFNSAKDIFRTALDLAKI